MRENTVEGERREGGCKRFPEPESNVGEDAADITIANALCLIRVYIEKEVKVDRRGRGCREKEGRE